MKAKKLKQFTQHLDDELEGYSLQPCNNSILLREAKAKLQELEDAILDNYLVPNKTIDLAVFAFLIYLQSKDNN